MCQAALRPQKDIVLEPILTVLRPNVAPKTPNEHFDRVPKNAMVNMRITTSLPHPPGEGRGAGI